MNLFHNEDTLSVTHGSSTSLEVIFVKGKKFEEILKSEDEYGSGFELKRAIVSTFMIENLKDEEQSYFKGEIVIGLDRNCAITYCEVPKNVD